jgi:hypothetical protein
MLYLGARSGVSKLTWEATLFLREGRQGMAGIVVLPQPGR